MSYVRQALYRLGDRLYGWGVLDCFQQFHQMQRWDAGRLEQFQYEALRRLLGHAYANVPFYRRLWDDAGGLRIDIQYVSDIPTPPTGKRRFVISTIGPAVTRSADRKAPNREPTPAPQDENHGPLRRRRDGAGYRLRADTQPVHHRPAGGGRRRAEG